MNRRFGPHRLLCLSALFIFALDGCAQRFAPVFSRTRETPSTLESTYCGSAAAYPNGVKVQGTALFNVRQSTSSGLQGEVAGGPIRYAEVQFADDSGKIIQCTETDSGGKFGATVPAGQNFTVRVNARGANAHVNVSVLDTPDHNAFYSLQKTFFSGPGGHATTTPLNLGTLVAPARGEILGGAFNIMFNILRANEALRFHLCGGVDQSCTAFSVAPKVTVYWKPGVNPYGYYFGEGADEGISFYVPGTDKLYILGGVGGDTDYSDTDHFDDSVISHEYGHFIEDHYARTDSPGGSHDGNHVIDPRLAWGEGWADFFSAFVRNDKTYRDTYGNADGGTGCYFDYDVDLNSNFGERLDVAAAEGEGNFREFAIARSLFDLLDPIPNPYGREPAGANGGLSDDDGRDNVTVPFRAFWSTFHDAFGGAELHFRSAGLFFANAPAVATAGADVLGFHKLEPAPREYGLVLPLISGPSCNGSAIAIAASDPESCSVGDQPVCKRGSLDVCCSNQFASNRFYDLNVTAGVRKIFLRRTTGNAQLDLYLYRDGYVFGDESTMAARNIATLAPQNPTDPDTKSIDVGGLTEGHYLLNVNVFTAGGNPDLSTFQLFINSTDNQVCP